MCIADDFSKDDSITAAHRKYRTELVAAGLLIPLGVPGVYGRSGVFEGVIEHFERFVTEAGAEFQPEVMHFPPLLARQHYLGTDHIQSFPNLMGSVHTFTGNERDHLALLQKKEDGEDWTENLTATDVMLNPAACYPLYPTARGVLPANGRTVDLRSFVFRHEPSIDPARMQIFRQREFVCLGTPEQALAHRNYWLKRGEEMLLALGLDVRPVVANDPFFGRGGRMMAATQKEQDLKYELVAPVASTEKLTAIASANCHLDHFGHAFGIQTADGKTAHSACVGFGLERIALALFRAHGFDPARWPGAVKRVLAL
jgi:seryl-tRNA synthetase